MVTGTHFSRPISTRLAQGDPAGEGERGQVGLDIDYRPVLWGLTSHGLGEERFIGSAAVTAHLQTILPECDLIVCTEEEVHVAGGTTDTMEAVRVRELAPGALISSSVGR